MLFSKTDSHSLGAFIRFLEFNECDFYSGRIARERKRERKRKKRKFDRNDYQMGEQERKRKSEKSDERGRREFEYQVMDYSRKNCCRKIQVKIRSCSFVLSLFQIKRKKEREK